MIVELIGGVVDKMEAKLWIFLTLGSLFIPAELSLSNGDVFLTGGTNGAKEGLLQIYFNGTNGTICFDNFNLFSAHAACRELGFIKANSFKRASDDTRYMYNTSNVSVILTDVNCPNVDKPLLNAELHLLRCPYSPDVRDCTDSVVLTCDVEKLRENPYNTQVWLKSTSIPELIQTPSTGILNIHLYSEWGLICSKSFARTAADAACLQKGFTNALAVTSASVAPDDVIWLSSADCTSLQSCLHYCFIYPPKSDVPDNCTDNEIVVLQCTFNTSLANTHKPGSEGKCDITYKLDKQLHEVLVATLVTFSIIICIIIVTILVTCYFFTKCPLYMYRRRSHYRAIV